MVNINCDPGVSRSNICFWGDERQHPSTKPANVMIDINSILEAVSGLFFEYRNGLSVYGLTCLLPLIYSLMYHDRHPLDHIIHGLAFVPYVLFLLVSKFIMWLADKLGVSFI